MNVGVDETGLTQDGRIIAATKRRLCLVAPGGKERIFGLDLSDIRRQREN